MKTIPTKETLVTYLRGWANDDPAFKKDEAIGICNNPVEGIRVVCLLIEFGLIKEGEQLGGFIKEWPEHSGDNEFPVPSDIESITSARRYTTEKNQWTGTYGESRKRLCLWLADKLESTAVNNA